MSTELVICYENRAALHTSRWTLDGLNTRGAGNTHGGWLWMDAAIDGGTLTLDLYKDRAKDPADKVLSGAADVSGADDQAVAVALAEANGSGLSGEVYVERADAPAEDVAVLAVLCDDTHLADHYGPLADLPTYDAATGMARYCELATEEVLLKVSQLFREPLGGHGGPEHRYLAGGPRAVPDYRVIAAPRQLRPAAIHRALALAFWACHNMTEETFYSRSAERHQAAYQGEIATWNPAFNTNPDGDAAADASGSASGLRVDRV
jgi:hypothetical protein